MTESDLTQIKIGKNKVGFVGLKETFKEIEALYSEQSDDVVAEELLNRLSKKKLHLRQGSKRIWACICQGI